MCGELGLQRTLIALAHGHVVNQIARAITPRCGHGIELTGTVPLSAQHLETDRIQLLLQLFKRRTAGEMWRS